jgi:hypothetical protein
MMTREIDENEIRQRAYRLWETEGRPEGRAADHWAAAEAELREKAETNPLTRSDLGTNIQIVEGGGDLQARSGRAQSSTWPDPESAGADNTEHGESRGNH